MTDSHENNDQQKPKAANFTMNVAASADGAPPPPPKAASLADRLAEVRVGMRGDLQVSRHLFRGVPSYIVRDPISFETHRLTAENYRILVNITNDRTLGDIFKDLVKTDQLDAEDEEAFYAFVAELHKAGFLALPITDSSTLNKRRLLKRQARMKQLLLSPIFLKLPGFNPDAFLQRNVGKVAWLFSRKFFFFWLGLMAMAGFTLVRNFDRLGEPLNSVMIAGNLPVLWVTLIVLKLCHEFGHAFACKAFGGKVPEMGIYLIAMTPCAFVDATDSWSFTSRQKRLIVCLAGMYIELTLAAIALIVWSLSSNSLINSIAFNVALLASVVTILFNINPLMRYDGYYAFTDIVEMPNLRERSKKVLGQIFHRFALGADNHHEFEQSKAQTAFLGVFGLASVLYRISVVLGISAMIATKLFLPGLAMGAFYLLGEISKALKASVKGLMSVTTPAGKIRAAIVASVCFAILPAMFFLLPLPDSVYTEAITAASTEKTIFAPYEGFIKSIDVKPGSEISAGDTISRIENINVQRDYQNALYAVKSSQVKLQAAMNSGSDQASVGNIELDTTNKIFKKAQEKLDKQNITAPISGKVLHCLDFGRVGGFVQGGEPVAVIAADGWKILYVLDSDQLTRLEPKVGDKIEFQFCSTKPLRFDGQITRVSPGGTHQLDEVALTHLSGGAIPVNPADLNSDKTYYLLEAQLDAADAKLMRGQRGTVKMQSSKRTMAVRIAAKLRRFFYNLRQ